MKRIIRETFAQLEQEGWTLRARGTLCYIGETPPTNSPVSDDPDDWYLALLCPECGDQWQYSQVYRKPAGMGECAILHCHSCKHQWVVHLTHKE